MDAHRFTLLAVVLLLAACGRGVVVESEPGPVFTLSIENPMSHAMDVWYDDGAETQELGRVEPHETREFIIAGPARTAVEIVARDEARTHSITRRVDLGRSGATPIILTP